MIELSKIDFVEEIKAEMAGYEEIEKELIDKWIEKFDRYINQKNLKDKCIKVKDKNIIVKLDDEADFFKIVDKYLVAIENEDLDAYWNNWSL